MAGTNLFGAARVFGFGLALAAALLVVLLGSKSAHAAEFAVNSTGDAEDTIPDGLRGRRPKRGRPGARRRGRGAAGRSSRW